MRVESNRPAGDIECFCRDFRIASNNVAAVAAALQHGAATPGIHGGRIELKASRPNPEQAIHTPIYRVSGPPSPLAGQGRDRPPYRRPTLKRGKTPPIGGESRNIRPGSGSSTRRRRPRRSRPADLRPRCARNRSARARRELNPRDSARRTTNARRSSNPGPDTRYGISAARAGRARACEWPRRNSICRLRLALASGISALMELWPSG